MKLTRRATILLTCVAILIMLFVGWRLMPKDDGKDEQEEVSYTYEVLLTNEELDCWLGGVVSESDAPKAYQLVETTLSKGDDVQGYTLSQKQSFSRAVQFKFKSGQYIKKKECTHTAYSFVLKGDVVRVTNKDTKESKIRIMNGHITYDRVGFYFTDEDETKVCLKSKKNGLTQTVSYDKFKNALNDLLVRDTMISWDKE